MPAEYYNADVQDDSANTYEFGFAASKVQVVNDGAATIHVSRSGTATTSSPAVLAGETYNVPPPLGPALSSISIVAASGASVAKRIYAYE